ncbi:MAG: hypothetical protein IMZ54_12600 [Acidobacteria bacterium]|nr:hypothetical protein [Acidobacteriota bacterium]
MPTDRSLERLSQDCSIGQALKFCFWFFWNELGGRPGSYSITAAKLGVALGKSTKSAREWIERLAELRLIEIVGRDKERGVYQLYVYHPTPGHDDSSPARVNPQLSLPLEVELPPSKRLEASNEHPRSKPGGGDAGKAGSPQTNSSRGVGDFGAEIPEGGQDLGDFGAEIPDPPGKKSPRSPEAEMAQVPVGLGFAASYREVRSGILEQKSPSKTPPVAIFPQCTNVIKDLSYQCTNDTKETNEAEQPEEGSGILEQKSPRAEAAGVCAQKPPRPANGEDRLAAPFEAALAIVAPSYEQQKSRMIAEIRHLVPELFHGTSGWLAGYAADLVLRSAVPVQELDHVLCDVAAMRAAGSLKNPGAFFNAKIHTLAAAYGVPWIGQHKQRGDRS